MRRGAAAEVAGAGADEARRRLHWRRTRRLTLVLLAVWFAVTFVVAWYARELNVDFFGWPLSFYMGAQGSLVVYLAIVIVYSRAMTRLDRQLDADEGAAVAPAAEASPPSA